MSEVVDVIRNPRDGVENLVEYASIASNQVRSTLLGDNPESKSRSYAVNGNDNDANQKINDKDLGMVTNKARKWIGVLVYREIDGNSYMGEVVNYCGETKLYKIDYENGISEEVDYEGLQQIVAPPPLVSEYLECIDPSENDKEKKKRHLLDTTIPIHPRRYSADQQPEPKRRKSKKPAGSSSASASSYIPLALRETKKDAYYYYYKVEAKALGSGMLKTRGSILLTNGNFATWLAG